MTGGCGIALECAATPTMSPPPTCAPSSILVDFHDTIFFVSAASLSRSHTTSLECPPAFTISFVCPPCWTVVIPNDPGHPVTSMKWISCILKNNNSKTTTTFSDLLFVLLFLKGDNHSL